MTFPETIQKALTRPLSRWVKFLRDVVIDIFLVVFSLWAASAVFGLTSNGHPFLTAHEFIEGALLGIVAVALLFWRGIYSINYRYAGLSDFLNIALVGVVSGGGLVGLESLSSGAAPRGGEYVQAFLFCFYAVTLLSTVRVVRRMHSWRSLPKLVTSSAAPPRRTLIIGAGDAGEMIMREISRSPNPSHQVVGFIDDDPEKATLRIHNAKVLGTTPSIPTLVPELRVEELVIALPSAKGEDMRRIISICQKTGARIRTLPAVKSLLAGGPHIFAHLREVDIEDLLRREPVQTDMAQIAGCIDGERVLITGGGGSNWQRACPPN